MRIYFVRHGETEENSRHIRQGQRYGATSADGWMENKHVSTRLKDTPFDAAFCSDLQRTRDTMQEIMAFHDLHVEYTELLRERGCGIFEGRPKEEYRRVRDASNLPIAAFKPEGGESLNEVQQRAILFFDRLVKTESKLVLVVSHAGILSTLFLHVMQKPITTENFHAYSMDNTGISIVAVHDGDARMEEFNLTGHLCGTLNGQ